MGWVKAGKIYLLKHKDLLGVLAAVVAILTALFSVIGHFSGGNGSKKEVILKERGVDQCQQTYGVKTPPKYIQNQSVKKCFYPLVYSWGYVNSGNLPSDWFSQKYFKSYKIDIANLSAKYNIDSTVSIASNIVESICFSYIYCWNKVSTPHLYFLL